MNSRCPKHYRDHNWQRRSKRTLAILFTALFLFLLTQIPYKMIREERIRAFGEAKTEATVSSVSTDEIHGQRVHLIIYSYVGPDGRTRQRRAPFPSEKWNKTKPGQRIIIYFAKGAPNLSRAHDEAEDGFRVWLRKTVRGNDLPEYSPTQSKQPSTHCVCTKFTVVFN